jgi:hypothetical protein
MSRSICLLAVVLSTTGAATLAADQEIYHGSEQARLDALAAIQPGLGTVMTEYANRFTKAYFAAQGGNWGLAQYQLKEMVEIQEVGEATRPANAAALKSFESGYLEPLEEAAEKKDITAFNAAFQETVAGCNGCHAGAGKSFIKYVLPQGPVEAYLDFTLKTEPTK